MSQSMWELVLRAPKIGSLTVEHFPPSLIGNLDPEDDRSCVGEGPSLAILIV